MINVLIIDDEIEMLESLRKILSYRENFKIVSHNDPHKAIEEIKSSDFDLIISDLQMKDVSGIDILKVAQQKKADTIVIIISGYGTIESSVEAVKLGAYDFIEKPFTSKKLFEVVDRGLSVTQTMDEESVEENKELKGIIHNSSVMKDVLNLVKRIASTEMTVLIEGESGTGKELIARAVHSLSKSKTAPFVPINCGALPEQLFESELFGHEKGAFTGAVKTKPGLLEFADGGTFFFDEVGEMSQSLQVKLLRMLEERKIRRVGGQKEIAINVRIIAATNKDLGILVQEGKFRDDLFYRLNNLKIELPPLRDRREDIMPLIKQYLYQLCSKKGQTMRMFTREAEEALKNYSWPGNVRELQNIVNRTFYLCSNQLIQLSDIPLPFAQLKTPISDDILSLNYKDAKEKIIEQFEAEYLTHHLKKNDGNISRTAEECSLDRRTIHRLISRYNIIFKNS